MNLAKIFIPLFLSFILILPLARADGMPHPHYRPELKEEHQIVFAEFEKTKMTTTLDLGVRYKPEDAILLLDEYVYLSSYGGYETVSQWAKIFKLPEDFEPEKICVKSDNVNNLDLVLNSKSLEFDVKDYSLKNFTLNKNIRYIKVCSPELYQTNYIDYVAIYTDSDFKLPVKVSNYSGAYSTNDILLKDKKYSSISYSYPYRSVDFAGYSCYGYIDVDFDEELLASKIEIKHKSYGYMVRVFTSSDGKTWEYVGYNRPPKSTYEYVYRREGCAKISKSDFKSVNTLIVKPADSYGSINMIYLKGAEEEEDKAKIIIPFKELPSSMEVGVPPLNIWILDDPFKTVGFGHGWYRDQLLTPGMAGKLPLEAEDSQEKALSKVTQAALATDASGSFSGKVSTLVGQASLSGSSSHESSGLYFREMVPPPTDVLNLYKVYFEDDAYVIEFDVKPFEVNRITIKWSEDVDADRFDYWYPLGTGKIWSENINYTVFYLKIPEEYMSFPNIDGYDEATKGEYKYYRWKFVEMAPDEDVEITIKKPSPVEKVAYAVYIPIIGLIVFLALMFIIIRL